MRILELTSLCFLFSSLLAMGDVVELKNGRSIEGVITEEAADSVTLDLGVGVMKIRKSEIARIRESTAGDAERIQTEWRRKNILQSRHVPKGLESLAKKFRELESARAAAVGASAKKAELERKSAGVKRETLKLYSEHLAISRQLQLMDPRADAASYNSTVAKNNTLTAQLALKHSDLERLIGEIAAAEKAIAEYLNELSAFESSFAKAADDKELRSMSQDYNLFFDEISRRLAPYRNECRTHEVATRTEGGSTLVTVLINDKVPATFVLDTGATAVSISEDLAGKLNIETASGDTIKVTLADGKQTEAKLVSLASVSAGAARAENIDAIVLPSKPGENIDGLLGMSFLGKFGVSLDANGQGLKLQELDIKSGPKR